MKQQFWVSFTGFCATYQYGPTLSRRRHQLRVFCFCLHQAPVAPGNDLGLGGHGVLLGQVTVVQVSSIDVRHQVVTKQQREEINGGGEGPMKDTALVRV